MALGEKYLRPGDDIAHLVETGAGVDYRGILSRRIARTGSNPLIDENQSDDEELREGLSEVTACSAAEVLNGVSSYREGLAKRRAIAKGIFDKLVAKVSCKPYPDELASDRKINLKGKFYLGRNSLYVFDDGYVNVFERNDVLGAFAFLELNNEEIDFIAARCFGFPMSLPAVNRLLQSPEGSLPALLGVLGDATKGSAVPDLTRYFKSREKVERGLEAMFMDANDRVA
jgi:hypothetical protein